MFCLGYRTHRSTTNLTTRTLVVTYTNSESYYFHEFTEPKYTAAISFAFLRPTQILLFETGNVVVKARLQYLSPAFKFNYTHSYMENLREPRERIPAKTSRFWKKKTSRFLKKTSRFPSLISILYSDIFSSDTIAP